MTIAVDWDVKHHTKNKEENYLEFYIFQVSCQLS